MSKKRSARWRAARTKRRRRKTAYLMANQHPESKYWREELRVAQAAFRSPKK